MKKLLVIVGPTGTGKTGLALDIAKKFSGEIVSADSRQIYQGMDVGTGKVDPGVEIEKHDGFWVVNGVKIHLFDLIKPDESFSVANFQKLAFEKINLITEAGKLPILVGGTGLYVQAVVEGLKIPKVPPDERLRAELDKKSTGRLLAMLEEVDKKTFEKIDRENRRRIIRALEVSHKLGKPFSSVKEQVKIDFDTLILGLISERQNLYDRVDKRIESWFKNGDFEKEVDDLLKNYPEDLPSFTSLGYQDVVGFLKKRLNRDEAIQRTKFKHHSYIRRQMTWFRKTRSVEWLDIANLEKENLYSKINNWLEKPNEENSQ